MSGWAVRCDQVPGAVVAPGGGSNRYGRDYVLGDVVIGPGTASEKPCSPLLIHVRNIPSRVGKFSA